MKDDSDSIKSMNTYLYMLLSVGIVWLRSSFGKITSGKFPQVLGQTLEKFASNNPYPWYKNYLQTVAIPNAKIIGVITMWSEFFVALSITIAVLYLLIKPEGNKVAEIVLAVGLLGGMILNLNFWLASGWMSPSGESINFLMFLIQFVGFVYLVKLLK